MAIIPFVSDFAKLLRPLPRQLVCYNRPKMSAILKRAADIVRSRSIVLALVTYGVALHGLLIITSTLNSQLALRGGLRHAHIGAYLFGLPLIIGLGLLYLSAYLHRRKRTAWSAAVIIYSMLLVLKFCRVLFFAHQPLTPVPGIRDIVLPAALVLVLVAFRDEFKVKSDIPSFAFSLRVIALVFAVAFAYGVAGFLLLDMRDFHQDITPLGAVQHTLDQFGLTSSHSLIPHTRRAKVFLDSLSVVSIGALVYAVISLFQPLRARFSDQSAARERTQVLLKKHPASSEDFFKLWPHDKVYFFDDLHAAGLAYAVHGGVALVVGDPFGEGEHFGPLLDQFEELCRVNDWTIAFVHTEPAFSSLYKEHGFSLQKIGEEAVLDLVHFQQNVRGEKYFRQIRNRFAKLNYTTEVLLPPHNDALIARLRTISDEWLAQPGRTERGFMLGYFSADYLQQCPLMVLRDAAGTIQAFINQIPSYDPKEANFDMLRHTTSSAGNSNDYLLMQFIDYVQSEGFARLNLGLCPLAGLGGKAGDEDRTVVDNALRFLYANGDRFYSFSGLHRFKSKYQPAWSGRFIAYRGGIRIFTRVLNSLNRSMKVKAHRH